jgi:hypothetical protein
LRLNHVSALERFLIDFLYRDIQKHRMPEKIPDDIRQFILQSIDSIAQWEGLLLLRDHPQARWSAQELARNLYISDADAAGLLRQLAGQGFLAVSGEESAPHFQYRPAPELEQITARAAEFYKKALIPVTNLIHSKSRKRVQEFADAFKIRKD